MRIKHTNFLARGDTAKPPSSRGAGISRSRTRRPHSQSIAIIIPYMVVRVWLILLISLQAVIASQAFLSFIRHGGAQIGIFFSQTGHFHQATLTEPTLGAVVRVVANASGDLRAVYRHGRAMAACYELNPARMVTNFKYIRTNDFGSYQSCEEIMVLLPRSGLRSPQEFLQQSGLFTETLSHPEWLLRLGNQDEFAVITFKFDANAVRSDVHRAGALGLTEKPVAPKAKL